jgi:phospholipase/carboxylesterase
VKLLVLLHGYGDQPDRLSALVPGLGLAADSEVLVPRGTYDGETGPAWVPAVPSPAEVDGALDHLSAEIAAAGAGPGETVVGGFSQGGAMALALGLRDGARWHPAAVFGMAAYLFAPDLVAYDMARGPGLPVLLLHGEDDDAVPVAQGRSAARVLERAGAPLRWREVEGVGHEPSPTFADDVGHWLSGL